jgi:hypothetical protein
VKWEPQHKRKATQAAAASGRAALIRSNLHGAGSSRIWPDVVPPGLPAAEKKKALARWDDEEKHDKITEAFGTFMINVVPVRMRQTFVHGSRSASAAVGCYRGGG